MYEPMLKISQRVEIMYEAWQKEIEEKEWLQLQLRATEEALEELKHNKQNLQTESIELKMLLHEENEGKQIFLWQLQAKDEALEKLQHDPCEVKSSSPYSCMFLDDGFAVFENHTIGIGSKLLKKMGLKEKAWALMAKALSTPSK